jgi:glycosyl transferase family 25
MEDDVRLADDLPALLSAIEEIDPDAGIIRLETTLRRVVLDDMGVALTPGRALHRMRSWHGGTAAYAIHHNAAADLLARSERISDPLDQWLFNPLSPVFGTLAIGQVVPGAAIQAQLLDRAEGVAATASTSGRKTGGGGRLAPRHGVAIDARRLALKLVERAKRLADRCRPGRSYRFIPFARSVGGG